MTYQARKLGEVCQVLTGGTPSRTKLEYFGGGIPWVKITDMLQGTVVSTDESLTAAGIENSSAKLMPSGTVLISIFATIGRTAVLGIEAATNQAIAGVVPKDIAQLDSQYLRYFLDSQHCKLNRVARGVAQPNINQGILKDLDVPLLPLAEQHRIVDILSRADGIVRLRREAEKKAAELIPALFLDMFGDPATNPKGWRQSTLDESGAAIRYGIGQPLPQIEGGLPFLRATNVKRGVISRTGLVYIDQNTNPMKRNPPLKHTDILVVRSGAYTGDIAQVGREFDGAIAGYDLVLSPGSEHLSEFLATYLLLPHVQNGYMAAHKIRAAQPHLNSTQLGNIVVPIPPLNMQSKFAENVYSVRSIQSQQSAATATAQATFDALLAQVFAVQYKAVSLIDRGACL